MNLLSIVYAAFNLNKKNGKNGKGMPAGRQRYPFPREQHWY